MRTQRTLRTATLTAALAALGPAGCQSKLTGNKGNFVFSYHATDEVADFNKPIAVGAKLDVQVATTGAVGRRVEVRSAATDDDAVLRVAGFSGDTVVLEGTGSGQALLSVTGKTPGGEVLDDEVHMQARAPEVVKLAHTCTSAREARYLVDQDVWLHFDMEMDNGQPVIGYGHHPVTLTPPDGLAIDQTSTAQEYITGRTAARAQSVTVASTVDDTAVTMVLVAAADIDGARLDEAGTRTPILVGATRFLHVTPTIGGEPVCQAGVEVEVRTTTPELCTVSAGVTLDEAGAVTDSLEKWGLLRVDGKALGMCAFTVTHPAASAGPGDPAPETAFEVEIAELVRGDDGGGDAPGGPEGEGTD